MNFETHSRPEGNNDLPEKQKSTRMKKVIRTVVLAGAVAGGVVGGTRVMQEHVNYENDTRNHAFSVDELTTFKKIEMLMGTTAYSSESSGDFAQAFPGISSYLRSKTQSGMVQVYRSELNTPEEAKKNIAEIRAKADQPILISADIEGGNINHFGFTSEYLLSQNVPKEIIDLRKSEDLFNKNNKKKVLKPVSLSTQMKHVVKGSRVKSLPSQEWIGRNYQSILDELSKNKTNHNEEGVREATVRKNNFLLIMEKYGRAMADICEDVGINVVFGPNLDMVKNIDGDTPIESEDRSYGTNYTVISDLSVSYLKGFGGNGKVLPVVKHFGNSFSETDPHSESTQSVSEKKDGSIIPWRDIINASSVEERKEKKENLKNKYQEELKALILQDSKDKKVLRDKHHKPKQDKIQKRKENQQRIVHLRNEIKKLEQQISLISDRKDFRVGIMPSTSTVNYYGNKDQVIPVVYNSQQIKKIRDSKESAGLGHKGLIFSDDLWMKSAGNYIDSLRKISGKETSKEALAVYEALGAGNTLALIKAVAGSEERIAKEVEKLIEEKVSFAKERKVLSPSHNNRNENGPDLTIEKVNKLVRDVLDLKVSMGLLSKEIINGKEYYILDPRIYNPSVVDVIINSAFSNQLPWTKKEGSPEKTQPSSVGLLYKAAYNFLLSFTRVGLLNLPSSFTTEERHMDAENESKKLIVIDKSVQRMFLYDYETRELEKEYTIGIGKGGMIPRRFVGDHSTPTGVYRLVQKRDDVWWREHKGEPLPDYYGGKEGGMLVLAGQWHPEIAIHGNTNPELGQVSNGCVRASNENIEELTRNVPLGSMIIITK